MSTSSLPTRMCIASFSNMGDGRGRLVAVGVGRWNLAVMVTIESVCKDKVMRPVVFCLWLFWIVSR